MDKLEWKQCIHVYGLARICVWKWAVGNTNQRNHSSSDWGYRDSEIISGRRINPLAHQRKFRREVLLTKIKETQCWMDALYLLITHRGRSRMDILIIISLSLYSLSFSCAYWEKKNSLLFLKMRIFIWIQPDRKFILFVLLSRKRESHKSKYFNFPKE